MALNSHLVTVIIHRIAVITSVFQWFAHHVNPLSYYQLLNPFQIIKYFGFSRYIAFTTYLDIVYIYIHSKCNVSRKVKMSYNLERMEYQLFTHAHSDPLFYYLFFSLSVVTFFRTGVGLQSNKVWYKPANTSTKRINGRRFILVGN